MPSSAGGAFGDNLAPVSDTTICSALTQGADITGVVKSRLRYSAVAAAITILFILFFGGGGSVTGEALPHDLIAEYMNPKGLLMLIPAILTIYLAIKKGDVIYAWHRRYRRCYRRGAAHRSADPV